MFIPYVWSVVCVVTRVTQVYVVIIDTCMYVDQGQDQDQGQGRGQGLESGLPYYRLCVDVIYCVCSTYMCCDERM